MIRSRKSGYEYLWAGSGKNIKFISEEGYSPYLEINGDFLNEFRLENEIKVNPLQNSLLIDGQEKSIEPGMSVVAEIKVGKRRVIELFIYPIIRYLDEGLSVR